MPTEWQQVEQRGIAEIPGLPDVRGEALPVYQDARGCLHEFFRPEEIRHDLNPNSPYQIPPS